jgi:hypothetical protein
MRSTCFYLTQNQHIIGEVTVFCENERFVKVTKQDVLKSDMLENQMFRKRTFCKPDRSVLAQ